MLDIVADELPCGNAQWEHVAVTAFKTNSKWTRAGNSCKYKFDKLVHTVRPTGSGEIPVYILRSKKIKEMISGKEVIGFLV